MSKFATYICNTMGINRTFNMIRNIKNWDAYLRYKFSSNKANEFEFELRNGIKVKVPKQVMPEFKECFFEEMYTKNLPKALWDIENPIIVDIGANIGFFSLYCHLKFKNPQIYAFEPVRRNYNKLVVNIGDLTPNPIRIFNKGVYSEQGFITLKLNNNLEVSTSASIFDNSLGMDEEKVETVTLKQILSEHNIPRIDLLKLDCEGSEYPILYKSDNELFSSINTIAIETHDGVNDAESLYSLQFFCQGLGFKNKSNGINFLWSFKPVDLWI
jgi:FkbM family methyltransferase